MSGDRGLRVFHRYREPRLVVEVLGQAQSILPGEGETRSMVRVNGQGSGFRAVVHPVLGFGKEGPHLAAGDVPAIVESGSDISLPLAQRIAIGLIIVGGNAHAEEVSFVITGELGGT